MATKICKYCGKEFEPRANANKYCSLECSGMANRINVKASVKRFKATDKYKEQKAEKAKAIRKADMIRKIKLGVFFTPAQQKTIMEVYGITEDDLKD